MPTHQSPKNVVRVPLPPAKPQFDQTFLNCRATPLSRLFFYSSSLPHVLDGLHRRARNQASSHFGRAPLRCPCSYSIACRIIRNTPLSLWCPVPPHSAWVVASAHSYTPWPSCREAIHLGGANTIKYGFDGRCCQRNESPPTLRCIITLRATSIFESPHQSSLSRNGYHKSSIITAYLVPAVDDYMSSTRNNQNLAIRSCSPPHLFLQSRTGPEIACAPLANPNLMLAVWTGRQGQYYGQGARLLFTSPALPANHPSRLKDTFVLIRHLDITRTPPTPKLKLHDAAIREGDKEKGKGKKEK